MNIDKPVLICMTATKNYRWITKAFIEANSLWADYIIIADQHSTDGTRELIAEYNDKVILIDNDDLEYNETSRSILLINRARKIKGDKIIFFLAIDEVFTANYLDSDSWKNIINSKKGDVFLFEWANLISNSKSFYTLEKDLKDNVVLMARAFHDDEVTPYNNQGKDMHTHCIPYPENVEGKEYIIRDFKILHFGDYNKSWNESKQRYYQFIDFIKNKRNPINLSRMYRNSENSSKLYLLDQSWFYNKEQHGFNIFDLIEQDNGKIFDRYILNLIKKYGIKKFQVIDVWDIEFIRRNNLYDSRSFILKLIHSYLKYSNKYKLNLFIRFFDYLLKIYFKNIRK